MKKLILFLLISFGLNAQFNYQAIVRHSSGQVITNNPVSFKFSLMYQSANSSPFYVEEHVVSAPSDGVVNLSVGGGTVVNGTFSDIDWSQSVFLKEELDSGNGYQDMGTRQIASVPVAEYAKRVPGLNTTSSSIEVLKLIISRGIDRNRGIRNSTVGQGGQVSIYSTMRDLSDSYVIVGNGGNTTSSNLWRDGEEVFLKVTPAAGFFWYYQDSSSNGSNYSTRNDADLGSNGLSPDNDYYYQGVANEEFIIRVIPEGDLTFSLDFLQ